MTFIYRSVSLLALFLAMPAAAQAQTLSPDLAILAPVAGKTWVGRMTSPDGQQSFAIERTFQILWDGSVVKFSTAAEVGSPSEGYYYWDREAEQVQNAFGDWRPGHVVELSPSMRKDSEVIVPSSLSVAPDAPEPVEGAGRSGEGAAAAISRAGGARPLSRIEPLKPR